MLPPGYYLAKAKRQCAMARHQWEVTYTLAKEPKIFLGIILRLEKAFAAIIKAVETYHRLQSRKKQKSKQLKAIFFQYSLSIRYLQAQKELNNIITAYKVSPIVFQRRGALIICQEHYRKMHKLSSESIKNYLVLIDKFIKAVERKCDVRRNPGKSA